MQLRKIAVAIIGSVLLVSGVSSGPVQAGAKISPNVNELGLDLRENSELGRMPSILFGTTNPNDQRTYLYCQDLNDPICTKASDISGRINLDICTPSSQVACISDVWAVDPSGNKIKGVFGKSVPEDPRYNLAENPSINLPRSHGVGAVWRFPGVMNSAGLDTYFVSVQAQANMQKNPGTPITSSGKLNLGNYIAGIIPVQEQSGNFQLLTATDAAHGGTAWGSNGTQYAQDKSVCAAVDLTSCQAIRGFPANYRFGITINFGEKLNGWFHGRLHTPSILTSSWNQGESVSIEANPVLVPSLVFMVPNSQIPDPVRTILASGTEIGLRGDGVTTAQISEDLSGPLTMDLVSGFAPAYKNTATSTDSFWSFRTLNSNSDAIQKCSDNSGNLAGLVTTNALSYAAGPPTFDAKSGSLVYKVASPHFQADGIPAVGTYDLSIRSDVARCIYKLSKAPIHAEVSVVSQDGVEQVATTTLTEKDGWLYLSANGFGYSNPTITVKLTQDAPAPMATPTPTPSESPSDAASVVAITKPATSPKKITITCVKAKATKSVTGVKPTCPVGYKKK